MPTRQIMHILCPHCYTTNRVHENRLNQNPACGHCKHSLFDHIPHDIDAQTFSKFISNNDIPLIIDCWASWCGPCRMFAPIFAQATAELEPYFRLVKLNTEANPTLSNQLGIRSIPTLIAFKEGKEIRRLSSALSLPQFIQWAKQIAKK